MRPGHILLLASLVSAACGFDRTRSCSADDDCLRDGVAGSCVPAESGQSWCAFDDPDCGVGGMRWGALAGDGLAGDCFQSAAVVSVTVTGMGVVTSTGSLSCGVECDETVAVGSSVELNAVADDGWTFSGWTGAASSCGTDPTCTLIVNEDLDVGATFVAGYRLTITLTGDRPGSVAASEGMLACPPACTAIVPAAITVDLTAFAPAGGAFVGWTGGGCGTAQECSVVMTGEREVVAAFADVTDWTAVAGDISDEAATAVAFDDGNVIVAGSFSGTLVIGKQTLVSVSSARDIFVIKYGPEAAPLWARRIGGTGDDSVGGLYVDAQHGIHIAGTFEDSIDFGTGPLVSAGGTDAFAAHLSGETGAFDAWRLGGPLDDGASGIAPGVPDIICGYFRGSVDFGVLSGTITAAGSPDAFIGDGTWAVTSQSPASGQATCHGLALDGNTLFAVGDFTGSVNFGDGAIMTEGSNDAFLVRVTLPAASAVTARGFGGTGYDAAHGVAVDSFGNVVVGGRFANVVDFGGGPMQATGSDGFGMMLAPSLDVSWTIQFGGASHDAVHGVAATASTAFFAGEFQDRLDRDGTIIRGTGGADGFVATVDSGAMTATWMTALGGDGDDVVLDVAAEVAGRMGTVGSFGGEADFGEGPVSSVGGDDIFVGIYEP